MNRLFGALLDRRITLVSIVRRAWQDPRTPVLARVLVVFAALYWINPCDLIPDLQPGGHLDDAAIAVLLMVMAFRLVPAAVFRDARKAINPAVCGVMFVSLATASAAPVRAPAQGGVGNYLVRSLAKNFTASGARAQSPKSIAPDLTATRFSVAVRRAADVFAKPTANMSIGKEQVSNLLSSLRCEPQVARHSKSDQFERWERFSARYLCSSFHSLRTAKPPEYQDPPVLDQAEIRSALPRFLSTRGGQRELYSAEDASGAILACNPACLMGMPPQLAGGFFVSYPSSGEGS